MSASHHVDSTETPRSIPTSAVVTADVAPVTETAPVTASGASMLLRIAVVSESEALTSREKMSRLAAVSGQARIAHTQPRRMRP